MKPALLVVGSEGHASVVIDVVEREGSYRIAGLLDSFKPAGTCILGYKVLGSELDFPAIREDQAIEAVIVAIGDNWQRARFATVVATAVADVTFATVVHPRAYVAPSVQLGPGTVVMAGCVVNTNCRVGSHCILNTNCSLDHDNVMEDYSSLGPNAATGGRVVVGAYTAVCIGATIVHDTIIGPHTVVGAGATVLKSLPERAVAFGAPAQVARRREIGEKYL